MKTYTLKKDSWHYWLATFGDNYRMYELYDICTYIRAIIVGTFQLLFVAAVISVLSGALLFSIGNMFSWLFLGYKLAEMTVFVFSLLASIISLFVIAGIVAVSKRRAETTEPGFVRLAYGKFKDKTCSLVEFE